MCLMLFERLTGEEGVQKCSDQRKNGNWLETLKKRLVWHEIRSIQDYWRQQRPEEQIWFKSKFLNKVLYASYVLPTCWGIR